MKSNQNEHRKGLARKLVLLTGIIVLAMVAAAAGGFAGAMRQIESSQQDAAALDRLVQARKFNLLIQQLNSGHTAEARRFLSIAFAADIRQAEIMGATANPSAAAEVKCALAQFARDAKAHPDYYAVAQGKKTSPGIQLARHQAGQ